MRKSYFSLFKLPITNRRPYTAVSVEQLAKAIKTAATIERQHQAYKEALRRGVNPRKAKENSLWWIFLGGICRYPDTAGLLLSADEWILDIDHAGADRVDELKERLFNDPVLMPELVFTSPSGDGVKAMGSYPMPTTNIVEAHKELEHRIMDYYDATYGSEFPLADRSGCDITRRCYLCHDADALYRIVDIDNWENILDKLPAKKDESPASPATPIMPSPAVPTTSTSPTLQSNHGGDKDPLRFLYDMTEVIERTRRDIAPEEKDFADLTFAIANSCGEAGRPFYYRICSLWSKGVNNPKYLKEKYDYALKNGNGRSSIGTVYHLFTQSGLTLNKS